MSVDVGCKIPIFDALISDAFSCGPGATIEGLYFEKGSKPQHLQAIDKYETEEDKEKERRLREKLKGTKIMGFGLQPFEFGLFLFLNIGAGGMMNLYAIQVSPREP